tara:strand:- start:192 stop:599 length:408 start_codon:yes stop_codon:yes gene_type:complete
MNKIIPTLGLASLLACSNKTTDTASQTPLPDLEASLATYLTKDGITGEDYFMFRIENTGESTGQAFNCYARDNSGNVLDSFTIDSGLGSGQILSTYPVFPATCSETYTFEANPNGENFSELSLDNNSIDYFLKCD